MKRVGLFLATFCLLIAGAHIACKGQTVSNPIPEATTSNWGTGYGYNYSANYSWFSRIISKDELQEAGIGSGASLSAILFYMNKLESPCIASNQLIWIKHIERTLIISSKEEPKPEDNGFTKVFEGTIQYSVTTSPEWFQIPFTTPFVWNGNDNIQVVTQNRHGSIITPAPDFAVLANVYAESRLSRGDGEAWPIPEGSLFSHALNVKFGMSSTGQIATVVNFNSPGVHTWVCPPDVYGVDVACWGGGGAGGSNSNAQNTGRGGGGGAAYSKKYGIPVVPGNSYTVFVGKGGVPTISSTAVNGEDSYFIDTLTVRAQGGKSGMSAFYLGGFPGTVANCVGDVMYRGGKGENGAENSDAGGGGASAGKANYGESAIFYIGGTAPAGGGDGGWGAMRVVAANGEPGKFPGGGGGGSWRNLGSPTMGGAGGGGRVIITFPAQPVQSIENYQKQKISLQNYPNPFSDYTEIEYFLPNNATVNLTIYNIMGAEVAIPVFNQKQNNGLHRITFYRDNLQPGIYLYTITVATDKEKFNSSNYMIIY